MIHKRLTSETWDTNEPRVKDRVGNTIVYYQVNSSSDVTGSIRQELDLMELASQQGVPVPRILSYSHVEELEVCTIEYIEGVPLDTIHATDPLARKAKLLVDTYIKSMKSVQRATTLNTLHLIRNLQVPATSHDIYLHLLNITHFHALRYQLPFSPRTIHELVKLFPEEPCVLETSLGITMSSFAPMES